MKAPRKIPKSPKKTAVVKPRLLNRLQKEKSENKTENGLLINIGGNQTNQDDENRHETSKIKSQPMHEERKRNEVIFRTPKRSSKKNIEIKCK